MIRWDLSFEVDVAEQGWLLDVLTVHGNDSRSASISTSMIPIDHASRFFSKLL